MNEELKADNNDVNNEHGKLELNLANLEYKKKSTLVMKTASFLTKSLSRYSSMKNSTYKQDKGFIQNHITFSELIQNNISTNPKSESSSNLNEKNTFGDKFVNDIHKIQKTANGLIEELKANSLKLSLQINCRQHLGNKLKSKSTCQMNILKLAPITVKEKDKDNIFLTINKNSIKGINDKVDQSDNDKEKEKDKDKCKDKENDKDTKDKNVNQPEKVEEVVVKVNNFNRKRKLQLTQREIFKKSQKVYFIPIKLAQAKGSFSDFELQVSAISDQLKLLYSNLPKLKSEFLNTTNFLKAFDNLQHKEKTKYNKLLEDTIVIMVNVVPKLLKKLYNSLDQIVYCKLPQLKEEEKKAISNEDECLIINVKLFHEVSTYFSACIEIFEVIKTKKAILSFTRDEYFAIKVHLDYLRFDVNNLISTAKTYIDKYYNDEKLISNFEVGCELKPKNISMNSYDIFDRIFQAEKASLKANSNAKVREINAILDQENKGFKSSSAPKAIEKDKQPYYLNYYNSLLNKPVVSVVMKYYTKETRDQIIANRIVERFRHNQLNELLASKEQANY